MNLSIIIPVYNEEKRIERTVRTYHQFFTYQEGVTIELVLVLNGCTDNTLSIVEDLKRSLGDSIHIKQIPVAGKGIAITTGFADALQRNNHLIGFVDADMATAPRYFFDLVKNIEINDGIIASRYMPTSQIHPARPWIKRWGSRLIYESCVWMLFGLNYYDLQCGAKVFTAKSLRTVVPLLTVKQWAFDVELLYLYKKMGYSIKERPTVWQDQAYSKLRLLSGFHMIASLFVIFVHHSRSKRSFDN